MNPKELPPEVPHATVMSRPAVHRNVDAADRKPSTAPIHHRQDAAAGVPPCHDPALMVTGVEQFTEPETPAVHTAWLAALTESAATAGFELIETTPESDDSPLAWARRIGVPEAIVTRASAQALHVTRLDSLADYRPAPVFIAEFPIGFARLHAVLAMLDAADQTTLAMPGVEAWPVFDTIQRILRRPLEPVLVPRNVILQAIDQAYEDQSARPEAVLSSLSLDQARAQLQSLETREDLLATDGQAPVIELVNLILLDAVKSGASDVHLQPYRDRLVVRYRIDGVLFDAHSLPKNVQDEAISRVKIMGKMNIAEKRLPQDGRATVTVGDRLIDLRIASLPGNYGERVVLRLLDKSANRYTLSQIGMDHATDRRFRRLIGLEHGLVLLTGPTGSGKTTTLYSALQEINTRDRNVVTLEDPIEYDIDGISQTQINTKKGLTFASGLRNVLRQDPDIIMVGEIRDHETAVMAIQSALTGHLVFSTLHTNDAASAVTRLLDLGIEPYLVSSSLLAVLAQRLVRKVCVDCATEHQFDATQRDRLGLSSADLPEATYHAGPGCNQCRDTGYRGRIAICELLLIDEPVRRKIQNQASATEIRDVALQRDMRLLRDDGLDKILAGITTPEEVARVTVRAAL